MHRPFLALWAFSLALLTGCGQTEIDTASSSTPVSLSAAFTDLDHVDVYSPEGDSLGTFDADVNFQQSLPLGQYLMDFVASDGQHSFLPDGRLAFAPMGQGYTPIDLDTDTLGVPVWKVEVNPVLEANARLTMRAADGDETLRPWKSMFRNWQVNLPVEDRDPVDDSLMADDKSYSYSTSATYSRYLLALSMSAAMTGSLSSACDSSTSCFSLSSSTLSSSTTATAYGIGPGYLQSYAANWATAVNAWNAAFGVGYVSCRDNPSMYSVACGLSIGSANGSNSANWAIRYACQSSSVTSTSPCYGPIYAHGGECKFFQNFITYNSGFSTSSGSYRVEPSDSTISGYALESAATITTGDLLRQPGAHSTTVVAIGYNSSAPTTPAYALVVDSNWVGSSGAYNEMIGAHVFSLATLSSYRKLDCIYSSTC